MISLDRFLVSSQTRTLWLEERAKGITATQVANAATPAGFDAEVLKFTQPEEVTVNAYMQHGIDREAHIAHVIKWREGIMPNDWLIAAEGCEWHLATPDGLSLDHKIIAEYKTSSKPLDRIPVRYMRQVQWQLHVTGAERCVFAYELRHESPYGFVPGFDVHSQYVERDDKMIADLIKVAERLQEMAAIASEVNQSG